jgi:hypothetical protein
MLAYVEQDIIRGENRTWVESGYYEILRRFDADRWLIVLPPNGVTHKKAQRTLTLVDNSEIMLTSNSGAKTPEGN